jgi:hypothetical protein
MVEILVVAISQDSLLPENLPHTTQQKAQPQLSG